METRINHSLVMAEFMLAQAVAANFYMRPSVVELLVRYVMSNFTPFDVLTEDHESTRGLDLERDVRALICRFVCRPTDFCLFFYHGSPSQKRTWSALVDPWGNGCAVPDSLFVQSGQIEVMTVLAALAADGDAHWSRVTTGDTMGHVSARSFRNIRVLETSYSPILMIAAVLREVVSVLAQLLERQHSAQRTVFKHLAASVWPLPATHAGATDEQTRDFLRQLHAKLSDERATLAQITELIDVVWKNMSTISWKMYQRVRDDTERDARYRPAPPHELAERFLQPV